MSTKVAYYEDYVYTAVSSNQVLQRNPSSNVARVKVSDVIEEFAAGGPYTIGNARDVYVGDVWVMAGQSNMRGHGWLYDPYTLESFTETPEQNISLFTSREVWTVASDPTHQLYTSPRLVHHTLPDPTVADPGILQYRGASLGLPFAKHYSELQKNAGNGVNMPVGLVSCAHGGTSMTDWQRPEWLDDETFKTTLYGALIDKIDKVGRIAGVLWYQGESDATTLEAATSYARKFTKWQRDLLRDVGYDDLPIVFVQIGPHRLDSDKLQKYWRIIQQQQYRILLGRAYTAGVTSIDCSLDDRLHLSAAGLKKLGRRMAEATLYAQAGLGPALAFPLHSVQYAFNPSPALRDKAPPAMNLWYNVNDSKLLAFWSKIPENIYGFTIESEDKSVRILAATSLKRPGIRLTLTKRPEKPVYISYGIDGVGVNLTLGEFTLPAFYRLKVPPPGDKLSISDNTVGRLNGGGRNTEIIDLEYVSQVDDT